MTAAERMVERECVGCGATFLREHYEVKRGNGLYCTMACKNTYARINTILDRKAALAERDELPTRRWPDERDTIPFRCPREHCGGMVEVDPPYGLVKVGEARCLSCTRVVALLRAGAVREIEAIPAGDMVACADCGIGFEAGARGRPAARCALCQRAREQAAAKAKRRAAR